MLDRKKARRPSFNDERNRLTMPSASPSSVIFAARIRSSMGVGSFPLGAGGAQGVIGDPDDLRRALG
jgi:hypothetical protein